MSAVTRFQLRFRHTSRKRYRTVATHDHIMADEQYRSSTGAGFMFSKRSTCNCSVTSSAVVGSSA